MTTFSDCETFTNMGGLTIWRGVVARVSLISPQPNCSQVPLVRKKRDPAQGWRCQEHRGFTTHPDHDRTRLWEGQQSETGKKWKKMDEWMFSFDFSLYRTKSQQPIIQSRLYYELRRGKMMVMMVSILFAMLCK